MGKPLTFVIIDDHPVVLQGLRYMLEGQEHMEVLACFTTGKEALEYLRRQEVSVVLQDIGLPDTSGIELCCEIKMLQPDVKVLVLSNYNERSIIFESLKNGASGYLLKNTAPDILMQGIKDALDGKLVLSEEVQAIMTQPAPADLSVPPRLTRREKEILQYIADGCTTAEIAEKLFISPLTVESHRRNLMQKFSVNNAPGLIKMAISHKFVDV